MKRYSLRRRLIAAALLLECLMVAAFSTAMHIYLWHAHMHAFNETLRGRGDSLLGQVHDAEDPGDNIAINPSALDLRRGDLWMVRDGNGRTLAQSEEWTQDAARAFGTLEVQRTFWIGGKPFRGLVLHGVRQIDADDTSPGIPRPVTIFYAASLSPVLEAIHHDERFLLLSAVLLLLLTGGTLAWLLRRGLAPVDALSASAASITPARPRFLAPESARCVNELAPLAGALESATQRLEDAFLQQQVFVHDAAHELKTAVTIVKSSLQLLASRPRTAREYASGLETCMADCARMEELVQRMLQLARFERGRTGAGDRCDLAEIARDVAAQMERLAEIRHVAIGVDATTAAMVPLEKDACASLLANLLLNAVQHTPAEGTVTAVVSDGSSVTLEVRDSGAGIAPEDLPHLFERFWRGDRSRARSTGGAGLGLSICKAIVDSCGGEISVDSEPGKGTRVKVKLPAVPAETSSQHPVPQSEPALP